MTRSGAQTVVSQPVKFLDGEYSTELQLQAVTDQTGCACKLLAVFTSNQLFGKLVVQFLQNDVVV